jgi:uncharacterized protein (TIGR03435 family)
MCIKERVIFKSKEPGMTQNIKMLTIFILLVLCTFGIHAQDERTVFKVGDMAPPFHLEAILQAPVEAEKIQEHLKGNVVVVEFWATWCGPCRKVIPHLNELVKEFESKPVQFLSVSDEEEWKVKNFLKVNPISGWIGLDRGGSLLKAYGLKTIPQTVIIDQNGRIAALTSPQLLNAALIETLLEGEPITPDKIIAESVGTRTDRAEKKKAETQAGKCLFELSIRPATPSNSMSFSSRSFKARGMTLHKLVSIAYNVSPVRLVASTPLAYETYAVSVNLPKNNRNTLKFLLCQSLEVTFGLKTYQETRDTDVYVLKTSDETTKLLRPSKHNSDMPIMSDDGQVSSPGTSIKTFCVVLEGAIGKVVLNETDLKDRYEIALYWEPDDPHSIVTAIGEQLGLKLMKETKPIEVTVFTTTLSSDQRN